MYQNLIQSEALKNTINNELVQKSLSLIEAKKQQLSLLLSSYTQETLSERIQRELNSHPLKEVLSNLDSFNEAQVLSIFNEICTENSQIFNSSGFYKVDVNNLFFQNAFIFKNYSREIFSKKEIPLTTKKIILTMALNSFINSLKVLEKVKKIPSYA